MPELADIILMTALVNKEAANHTFKRCFKSSVHRCREVQIPVSWSSGFTVSAKSRGKEMMLTLQDASAKSPSASTLILLLFHMGMTGTWNLLDSDDVASLPKHAHFMLVRDDGKCLAHIDVRRLGGWEEVAPSTPSSSADASGAAEKQDGWGAGRGPDPVQEYDAFQQHIFDGLDKEDPIFEKPICEVMLDQEYFNGIGNYLRSEIMHRAHVRPFDKARSVLEACRSDSGKTPDLMRFCKTVPEEVIRMEYVYGSSADAFKRWIQCYEHPEANWAEDANKRRVYYFGSAGSLLPKGRRTGKGKRKAAADIKKEVKEEEEEEEEKSAAHPPVRKSRRK